MLKFYIAILALYVQSVCHAHGGIDHTKVIHPSAPSEAPKIDKMKVAGDFYKAKVEPVFKNKCFDCHSSLTKFPWYSKVPGINFIVNHHIKEAREHMDFSNGFPFKGHASPIEDLKALMESVKKDDMPPWYYRPFHQGSGLTDQEKKDILEWVESSLKLFK